MTCIAESEAQKLVIQTQEFGNHVETMPTRISVPNWKTDDDDQLRLELEGRFTLEELAALMYFHPHNQWR